MEVKKGVLKFQPFKNPLNTRESASNSAEILNSSLWDSDF